MEGKPKRGGKRKGAGRPMGAKHVDPSQLRIRFSIRLPQYMIEWIEAQDMPAGRVIELALENYGCISLKPKKE